MAVPLACLLLVLIAGVHAVLPVKGALLSGELTGSSGTMIEAGDARRTIDNGWHLQGILEPKSRMLLSDETHGSFLTGEAILSSPGYNVLSLDALRSLTLLDATIWISRDTAGVSIVPLDAPVLFVSDGSIMIIPAGSQLRIAAIPKLSPVPSDWLLQKTGDAASISVPDIAADAGASDQAAQAMIASLFRSDALLSQDDLRALLTSVRQLDDTGTLSGLTAFRLALSPGRFSAEKNDALSTILKSSPIAQAALGALPSVVASTLKPVAGWLIDDWAAQVIRNGMDDPQAGLSILREYQHLPDQLRSAGYPVQSDLWQSALSRAQQTLLPLLSPLQRTEFDLQAIDLAVSSPLSTSSVPVEPQYTEKQLLATARQMLVSHGALIGSATHLLPLAGPPQAVRIVGIFIAEAGKDIPYEFTFDPAANQLSNIIRNGIAEPNAVPVEVFFQ